MRDVSKQYKSLAAKGRYGDTMLAHINTEEAALLKSLGGAGTINPKTGFREFPPSANIGMPAPYQAPFGSYDMRSAPPSAPAPFDSSLADRRGGKSASSDIVGYTLPTDKTFQGKPLVAKSDAQGNFLYYTMQGADYLVPDPSQPNIISQPRLNAQGEVIDYGVVDLNKQDSGGFGSMISELGTEFAPMIAAAIGANYLAGSGLLSGAGSAGALSPYAAQAAGAYGGSAAAAQAAAAGSLTGIQAASAAQNALTQQALTGTGITFGQGVTPTPTPSATTPPAGSGSPVSGMSTGAAGAGTGVDSSVLSAISSATGISVDTLKTFAPSVIQGLLSAGGSYLQSEQAKEAAQTQANAQIRAAQIAADAARFRPVGVTTRFGSSNFTTDAAGNVITAGYTPSAEITGYQDRLRTLAGQGMTDIEGARTAYAPLTGAAQNLFSLGGSYIKKSPEEVAADYIAKQQALLAPSQENQLAMLQNKLFQQGRTGAATAQGGNLMATSPEMAAYYNSLAQSNLVLAAQADQEAQNRIKFGAGLFGTGADLQGRYYTGQTAAYSPFTTAMDTSSGLERLAQQPLDLSTAIGSRVSTANANVGQLTGQGIINAASTMAPANAYSGTGNLLSGVANSPVFNNAINNAFGNQPKTMGNMTIDPITGNFVEQNSYNYDPRVRYLDPATGRYLIAQ